MFEVNMYEFYCLQIVQKKRFMNNDIAFNGKYSCPK